MVIIRESPEIQAEIREKIGFLPSFFEPAVSNPLVLEGLWQQTMFAYLYNPLPTIFKEKLSAYLASFCSIPYCLIFHCCILRSLGVKGSEVLKLLESPLPGKSEIEKHLKILSAEAKLLASWPESNSLWEESLLLCAIYISLATEEVQLCRNELRRILGDLNYQHLVTLIAYNKTCFFWLESHPEINYESEQKTLNILLTEEPNLAKIFNNYNGKITWECKNQESIKAQLSENKKVELEWQQSEEKFRQLAENIDSVFWMTDPNKNQMIYVSPAYEKIWGYSCEELYATPKSFVDAIHPEDRDRILAAFPKQILGEYQEEYRVIRPDGEIRWIRDRAFPIQDSRDKVYRVVGIAEDISDRKQAEQLIQASLEEKEVLLREIHHRVKNNLQIISSLLSLQADNTDNPEIIQAFADSQNRIQSMALIHEQLYQSKSFAKIDLASYVKKLVNNLFGYFSSPHKLIELRFHSEQVYTNLDTAIPCGLIINELVSNAFKHGFPDRNVGEINVDIHQDSKNYIILVIRDNGVGLPPHLNLTEIPGSLGLQLVYTLTEQLNGKLEINFTNGTEFKLTFAELKLRSRMVNYE